MTNRELRKFYHERPLAEYRAKKEEAVRSQIATLPENAAQQIVSRIFLHIAPDAVRRRDLDLVEPASDRGSCDITFSTS